MKKIFSSILILSVLSFYLQLSFVIPVEAAAVTSYTDSLSTLTANASSTHDIQFTTPTGIAGGGNFTIQFGSGFIIDTNLTYTDIDVATNTVQVTLAGTPSGTTWGVARTNDTTLTFTNGSAAISAGTIIRVKIGPNATNQSTGVYYVRNPGAGNNTVAIAGGFGDTGTTTIPIIADSQVAVTATVAQSLTFSISDNTIGFGTLTTANSRYATGDTSGGTTEVEAHNIIAGTNAASGYSITATGTTLTSGANTITAIGGTNTASSSGTEQFGIRLVASGGSGAVNSPYAASGYAFDTASFPDTIATSSTASANTTYSVRYVANIASETEAGSYTSTITYSATANF